MNESESDFIKYYVKKFWIYRKIEWMENANKNYKDAMQSFHYMSCGKTINARGITTILVIILGSKIIHA